MELIIMGQSAKLFLNGREIIILQVRFLYQNSSNEEDAVCSKWDENAIIDTQMVARSCLPAALKNKCNWSLCSAAKARRETKANCHKNYVQLSKFYTKTHHRKQEPGSGRAEKHQGRCGTSGTKADSSVAELWHWRPIYFSPLSLRKVTMSAQ